MPEMILSPSLLSSDFSRMGEELRALQDAGLKWAHLDVMDGRFVPNITFGPPIIAAMRKTCDLFFDCHLMIVEPERYVEEFAKAGANLICVHQEACTHLDRVVHQIRDAGCKAAVALNPATPVETVEYLLPDLDMVLIMSVNPGFGGQSFIPYTFEKIRRLKALITTATAETLIQVDGGVSPDNARALCEAGADVLVSGSAFFKLPPYRERHEVFQKAVR